MSEPDPLPPPTPSEESAPSRGCSKKCGALLAFVALAIALGVGPIVVGEWRDQRMWGNQHSVIWSMSKIGAAQNLFREKEAKRKQGKVWDQRYGTLAELGAAGLLDEVLASGTKNGYLFEVTYSRLTPEFLWYAVARPQEPGVTGTQNYWRNHEGGAVYYGPATSPCPLNDTDCQLQGFGDPEQWRTDLRSGLSLEDLLRVEELPRSGRTHPSPARDSTQTRSHAGYQLAGFAVVRAVPSAGLQLGARSRF